MNILNKHILDNIAAAKVQLPAPGNLQLPEKVLQFGTGVLLRGLPDFYIDQANKAGHFGGRVVMVKSTDAGADLEAYVQQDMLFTHCIRGLENGQLADRVLVNASVSRILSARQQWQEVLACAADPEISIIISNTTEAGLQIDADDKLSDSPPISFPAKLLAVLQRRYEVSHGDPQAGFVILPTELVTHNGAVLKGLVMQLARQAALSDDLLQWLDQCNYFCNTLVDRIVPGKLPAPQQQEMEQQVGYVDPLMIMSEPFNLWAIESGSPVVRERLAFAACNPGIIITDDISGFAELKLRLLNGTHTFLCALAMLHGFPTVREAMAHHEFAQLAAQLVFEEILPCVMAAQKDPDAAMRFAKSVLDRFANPFLDHSWQSIALNYTDKMKLRNLPLLQCWQEQGRSDIPVAMALGFAAYLLYCKCDLRNGQYAGRWLDVEWGTNDRHIPRLAELWRQHTPHEVVHLILAEENIWGINLAQWLPWKQSVEYWLRKLMNEGAASAVLEARSRNTEMLADA